MFNRSTAISGALLASVLSLGLAGCSDSSSDSSDGPPPDDSEEPEETASAQVRVIHAVADAPDVNVLLDSGDETETFEGLGFRGTTALTEVAAGTYDVTLEAVLPDGSAQEVLTDQVELTAGDETTLVAAGSAESEPADTDPGLKLVEVTPSDDPIGESRARYTAVHAAADADPVDIFATTPDFGETEQDRKLASIAPITLSFDNNEEFDNQGSADLFAGLEQKQRRIRIVPNADDDAQENVVFDTGSQLPPVPDGEDILAIVIDNVGTGAVDDDERPDVTNPVRLLLIYPDGQGGSNVDVFRDKDAQPAIRAAHLSQDAGSVVIRAGGNPVLTNVTFPGVVPEGEGFLAVPGGFTKSDGSVNVDVDNGTNSVDEDLPLTDGDFHTGYAAGLVADDTIDLFASNDDIRPVATEARVRVVHAASVESVTNEPGGPVDVYAGPTGTDLGLVLEGVEFTDVSPYLSLGAGDYDFEVFVAQDDPPETAPENPALSATLTLEAGDVTTVIARDEGQGFALDPVNDVEDVDMFKNP